METEIKPKRAGKTDRTPVKAAFFLAVSWLLAVFALPKWANHRDAVYVARHDCRLDAEHHGSHLGIVVFGWAVPTTEKDEYYYECQNPDVLVEVDK
jgi:hypothetical protein